MEPKIDSTLPADPHRHDNAVAESRDTRQEMLQAMSGLEQALANATPHREPAWRARVGEYLAVLEREMREQASELRDKDGLLQELLIDAPRLDNQIENLRNHFDDLVRQIEALRKEFSNARSESPPEVADMRQRISWLLTALRHFQTQETDLIYEAIQVDIGVGD